MRRLGCCTKYSETRTLSSSSQQKTSVACEERLSLGVELTSFGELVTLTGCKATVVLALRTSGGRQVQKTSCILRHQQHAVAEFPLPQQLGLSRQVCPH